MQMSRCAFTRSLEWRWMGLTFRSTPLSARTASAALRSSALSLMLMM